MEPMTQFEEDALAEILQSVHLHGTLYCRAQLRAPWGLAVPHREMAVFHIVTEGACWLHIEGVATPISIEEGELVILPHGHAHTVADRPETPVTLIEDFVIRHPPAANGIVYGSEQGKAASLVCGGLELEDYPANPLYAILPTYLHAPSREGDAASWVEAIVQMVRAESSGSEPGAETVIRRLSEILFIQAVRMYLRTSCEGHTGWLAAVKDPEVGRALALIRQQPERPWTVGALANQVGLSRSAFAAKFAELVGEPPMQYLTRVRIAKGAKVLRTQATPVSAVAAAVGYESEVTFSKAFKRWLGVAPGEYRRGRRAMPAEGLGRFRQEDAIREPAARAAEAPSISR